MANLGACILCLTSLPFSASHNRLLRCPELWYCLNFLSSIGFQGSAETLDIKSFAWMAGSLIPTSVSENTKLCFAKLAFHLRAEPLETVVPLCCEAKLVCLPLLILGCL